MSALPACVRRVRGGWRTRLRRRVEAVAGPPGVLVELAMRRARLPRGCRRLIVCTPLGSELLLPSDRDLLWRSYELPIFEHLVSDSGELLAAECDAHDGLHVLSETLAPALDAGPCGCGWHGPRLIPRGALPERFPVAALSP